MTCRLRQVVLTTLTLLHLLAAGACQAGAQERFLSFKIHAADGQPAQVWVQGKPVGNTDELLKFDISRYREPITLDVVLSRKGFVPTLHSLQVPDVRSVWEPPPLGLLKPVQEIALRSDPIAEKLFVEGKDGDKIPAGSSGSLSLEVEVPAFGRPYQPAEVVVYLEREGYLPTRQVLPPQVWFASTYPPLEQQPLVIPKAPGWRAWWTRYSREQPIALFLALASVAVVFALLRIRYHYLRRIEAAHRELQQWVERLDSFVNGSRELAAPLTIEDLAQSAVLQARRLCRSPWALFVSQQPPFSHSNQNLEPGAFHSVLEHLQSKGHPLRIDKVTESRFEGLPKEFPSLLCQPLMFKGEYRGAVIVGSGGIADFQQVDQEALGVLAAQLAAALERIHLHKETVDAYEKLAESEAQLIQAAKMSAVGQLAAGVAHELNTPLNAITFGVEMAQSTIEQQPARAQKRLTLVLTAARKASEIVRKLLYYSREARLDDQEFTLKTLLTDTQDFLRFQLDQDGISLKLDAYPDAPIKGNLNELSQVLSNLILNARDAILKGDFPKTVTLTVKDRVGSVEILVADRASGVPEELEARIFDPFFTTKDAGEGTGLGLSVSRKIMEKHGGDLTLQSAHDPCCFALRLPKSLTAPEA